MSNLVLDIEYLLAEGKSFAQVARELEIPVSFVAEANEIMRQEHNDQEDFCSPYATINS